VFQHGNFEHKMENTVGLIMLLAPIETLSSSNVALTTIIICGFSGSWFNIVYNNMEIHVIGASAICYGCLPVFLFIFTKSLYKNRSSCWPLKDIPTVLLFGTFIPWVLAVSFTSMAVIYEGVMLTRADGVSHAAHFGGILGGFTISAVLAVLEKLENKWNSIASPVQSKIQNHGLGDTGATEQTEMVSFLDKESVSIPHESCYEE